MATRILTETAYGKRSSTGRTMEAGWTPGKLPGHLPEWIRKEEGANIQHRTSNNQHRIGPMAPRKLSVRCSMLNVGRCRFMEGENGLVSCADFRTMSGVARGRMTCDRKFRPC